ncbi:MAG: arsenite/tail-anchored protein-transporting ATPase [Synergistaceae bacterium]|jgi:arsenite-transporting ATPase|nr:arsenite/tail-anchored protein-transporting ATPase [Synergistaceae bacterium]
MISTEVKRTMKQFTFFGGKGGTGKTSCAASYSLSLAARGMRTFVVSTDPAHSLADAFNKPIGFQTAPLAPNLWGLEIDAEVEAKKYMKSIQDKMLDLVSAAIVDEIKRQIEIAYMSPGAEEAAIFDKFIELMESVGRDYDAIVFDTAPTGHTLRLLTLPEILGAWIEHLIEKRQKAMNLMKMAARYDKPLAERIADDPIIRTLTARKDKFALARKYLTDRETSVFYFVLNPEKLPILETARAVELLSRHGIAVGGVVVNKVIPPDAGPFLEKKRLSQEGYLREIRSRFSSMTIVELPMLDDDIQGMDQLQRISALMGGLDS